MPGEWSYELAGKAHDDFDALDPEDRERVVGKLDEIVSSPWREPPEYGEPLQGSPYRKVRIGPFRLSVTFDHDRQVMVVARIRHRDGAYTADDD